MNKLQLYIFWYDMQIADFTGIYAKKTCCIVQQAFA